MGKFCLDCKKQIDPRSTYCKKCALKGKRSPSYKQNPKENPNYKTGNRSDNPPLCSVCKNKLKCPYAKKCRSCYLKSLVGKGNPMFGKISKHGTWGTYKNIKMRSSWEIKFAQFLDLSGYAWKYEPKAFDLGASTYTPDFYLPEFDVYIEIKGFWRNDAIYKFSKFLKLYKNINIIVMDRLGLLLIGVL